MRKSILIAGAAGALALTGAAIAQTQGPVGGAGSAATLQQNGTQTTTSGTLDASRQISTTASGSGSGTTAYGAGTTVNPPAGSTYGQTTTGQSSGQTGATTSTDTTGSTYSSGGAQGAGGYGADTAQRSSPSYARAGERG